MRNWSAVLPGAAAALFAAAAVARPPERPLVIAHRGGALLMPENTFPAFDNAVRLGADLIEFDMQETADDRLIITHDAKVNASFCTDRPGAAVQPGLVRQMTLAQLLQFDCGSRHRASYPTQEAVPDTPMPTPDAFFARYKASRVLFFGETKMPRPDEGVVDPVAFTRLVAASVRRHGLEDRFILQSADYRTIDAMHAIDPRIRTCLLSPWRVSTDYLQLVRQHHARCILLRQQDTTADQVATLRRAGVMVFSDVVDDEAGWRAYRDLGMSAIFTNDPASLSAFLSRKTS